MDTAEEVLDSSLVQRLREQQTTLEGELAELSTEYGELHPRMIQLRAEERDLGGNIDSEIEKIVVGLRNQMSIADARGRILIGEFGRPDGPSWGVQPT